MNNHYKDLQTFVFFIGYPRSGHSLVGSLIDAHENAIIAHEEDIFNGLGQITTKEQLFDRILTNSKQFTEQERNWTGYTYQVPNQFNGVAAKLLLIGDKKGGKTSLMLHGNLYPIKQLEKLTKDLELKLVHIIRNPFDNITTMYQKGSQSDLESTISRYFKMAETNFNIIKSNYNVHNLHLEDLILDSTSEINNLFTFLDLKIDKRFVSDCESILLKTPRITRNELRWTEDQINLVTKKMSKFPFFWKYKSEEACSIP